jgi:hypothetical protein
MGEFFEAGDAVRMLSFANDVANLKAILERRASDVRDSSQR